MKTPFRQCSHSKDSLPDIGTPTPDGYSLRPSISTSVSLSSFGVGVSASVWFPHLGILYSRTFQLRSDNYELHISTLLPALLSFCILTMHHHCAKGFSLLVESNLS